MTLSNSGVIYLHYNTGRIYFSLKYIDNKYCDYNSMITDVTYNRNTKIFSFRYRGSYECDNLEKKVDFIYKILFELKKILLI